MTQREIAEGWANENCNPCQVEDAVEAELQTLWAREKLLEAAVEEYKELLGELPGGFDTPALDTLRIASSTHVKCAACHDVVAHPADTATEDPTRCEECWNTSPLAPGVQWTPEEGCPCHVCQQCRPFSKKSIERSGGCPAAPLDKCGPWAEYAALDAHDKEQSK